MSTIQEQFKHDLPWIGGGAAVIAMLIDEVEALKLAQQEERQADVQINETVGKYMADAEQLRKQVHELREALTLCEHKIDQSLQGQYPNGRALGDALMCARAALAKTEPRPEPTQCVYCGPTCYGGAAHNQRVENGDKAEQRP